MTTVVDRLLELLLAVWRWLVPWTILTDEQLGLVRRFGVYRRDLRRGWNWKWPVIEEVMAVCSALDSTVLREQSLTTNDGKQVTLRGVITYRVTNARVYIIEVDNPDTVINDAGCLAISELVPELTAKEVLEGPEFPRALARRVRARAKRWGVEIDSVGLADRTAAPTVRLMGTR